MTGMHVTLIDEVTVKDDATRYVVRCTCGWTAAPKAKRAEAITAGDVHRANAKVQKL